MTEAALFSGFLIDFIIAAAVVPAIDDRITATRGVSAVNSLHGRLLAASMGLVVVDLVSTAGRVTAVYTVMHCTGLAAYGIPVVVDGSVTTTSVPLIGLWFDDTDAADLASIVVGIITAAAGCAFEVLLSQMTTATDVVIPVIDHTVAAAVCGTSVNLRPAATGV